MQSLSPTSRYLSSLEGSHQPDDVQREAVSRLDTIYHELQNKPSAPQTGGGLRAKFGKLLGKREPVAETVAVRASIWGRRRQGKTWLMDLFYQSLPGERKQRLHFHRFMLRVMKSYRTQGKRSAGNRRDRFKAETDVLLR
jgi:cell division protein ZapE